MVQFAKIGVFLIILCWQSRFIMIWWYSNMFALMVDDIVCCFYPIVAYKLCGYKSNIHWLLKQAHIMNTFHQHTGNGLWNINHILRSTRAHFCDTGSIHTHYIYVTTSFAIFGCVMRSDLYEPRDAMTQYPCLFPMAEDGLYLQVWSRCFWQKQHITSMNPDFGKKIH